MGDHEETQNELERAIAKFGAAGDDSDYSARRGVLVALATSTVTVMLAEPWDGRAPPATTLRPMMVSDGPNLEQPMLAVFTRPERAREFQARQGGAEHPSEVPGPWAILATPDTAGIIINPNSPLGFRATPELIRVLRSDVEEIIERAQQRAGNP